MSALRSALRLALVITLLLTGPERTTSIARAADVLWLPPAAHIQFDTTGAIAVNKGRATYIDGSNPVAFALSGDREDTARQITQHCADIGWRQRERQHMNPRHSTSFQDGWQSRCACVIPTDAAGHSLPLPTDRLYEWHGEWENDRGDILTYDLSVAGNRLNGFAAFVPASVVVERRYKLQATSLQ